MHALIRMTLLVGFVATSVSAQPLENMAKYLAKKDTTYGWRITDVRPINPLVSCTEMIVTSQTWRGLDWHHRVMIYHPKKMKDIHHAFLLISGGGWNPEAEAKREARLKREREAREAGEAQPKKKPSLDFDEGTMATMIVNKIKMPVIVLRNVPLQPIFDGKTEDAIISYTFEQYVETGEADWPLLLPMTKSAVRTMDAMQEMGKKEWKTDLKGFIVAGGSKRGWTTWLTAAMDDRVTACAPAVIDVLNMPVQMVHQLYAWGKYSEMISDYTMRDIQDRMGSPRGKELLRIVDPYSYRKNVTMPKMLIIGTNDRYWPVDALNIYWDNLVGDKYILYVPNKGHAAIDIPRLIANCSALTKLGAGRLTFPKMTWKHEASDEGLTLTVKTDAKPKRMWAWKATSDVRDFREVRWTHEEMTKTDDGFVYKMPMPDAGYAVLYGEGLFPVGENDSVYLCTTLKVIGPGPNTPEDVLEQAKKAEAKAKALSKKTGAPMPKFD